MTETSSLVPLSAFLSHRPRFEWRGEAFEVESRKPLALLCYLTLQPGSVPREQLAELLWGPERLLNVRQALYQLRQLPGAENWLIIGESVHVNAVSDVRDFERALRAERYGEALEAWQPPLLEGLEVPRAQMFDEWLEVERARLEVFYLRVLEGRAAELEREGKFAEALELVRRFLSTDPLRESAYRSAMRLSYMLGNADEAMDAYRKCLKVMRSELDSEPLPTTIALARAIANGEPLSVAVSPGHLPTGLLRILQALVVSGGILSTSQLANVLDLDEFEVAEGLAGLVQRRLLTESGGIPESSAKETLEAMPGQVRVLLNSRIADVLSSGGRGFGAEEAIGRFLLGANRPDEAALWLLALLKRSVRERDDEQLLVQGFRVLWCGNTEERFEAAMLMEAFCERTGRGELQDALLLEARDLAWDLQQDRALARVNLRRSRRSMRQGELSQARKLAREALATARRIGDALLAAQGTNAMGAISFMEGRLAEAQDYFAENEDSDIPEERYRALNNLGAVAGLQGNLEASFRYLEQTLTLARRTKNVSDIGACLNNLAATAERMADYSTAIEKLREGRDLAQRMGNRAYTLQTLLNLAQVHQRQGSLGPAWNTAQEALSEAAELADTRGEAQALEQLGQIARLAGAMEESAKLMREALERLGSSDARRLAEVRTNLALSLLAGDFESNPISVAKHVEELEGLGSTEVARWFWAELALFDRDSERAREWSSRALAEGGQKNRHLALLGEIATLRAALLGGDGATESAAALANELQRLEAVETPLGHQLLALAAGAVDSNEHSERARLQLASQGEGLPKRLRESLMRQPERWEAAIGF